VPYLSVTNVEESLSDTRRWKGWSGTPADLRQILDAMESQYAVVRDEHVAAKTYYERRSVERSERQVETARRMIEERREAARDTSAWEDRLADARRDVESETSILQRAEDQAALFDRVVATIRTKKGADRTLTGRPAELVAHMTPIAVKDLTLRAPARSYVGTRSITVTFDHEDGVTLSVTSDDAAWARAALSVLEETIELRVPWWRWVRSGWVLVPAFYLAIIFLAYAAINALPSVAASSAGPVLYVATLALVPNIAFWLVRKGLPAFELTLSGQARGRAVLVTVAGWVVSVVLGVVTNMISG